MKTKIRAILPALLLLSLCIVSCHIPFKDGSFVSMGIPYTDNPNDCYTWGTGDRLHIEGASRIDPEEGGVRWTIHAVLEDEDAYWYYIGDPVYLYEKNGEDPEDKNFHEWDVLFDNDWGLEKGTYYLQLVLRKWRERIFKPPDYEVIGWVRTEDWAIEVVPGGHTLGDFTGIIPFCGHERYGGPGECLDYPIAFPLTVQVFRNGEPRNQESVKFTIYSNNAFFIGQNPNEVTGTTQTTLIGDESNHSKDHNNDSCGCEKVKGAFKCPLYIKPTPNENIIEVEAEWLNPPEDASTTTTANFKITPLPYEEFDELLDDKGGSFHEKDAFGKLILGDGLWSYWKDPNQNQIPRDPNIETKDIQLEIDWMSNLGPDFNNDGIGDIQLTFDDIEYICTELNRIYNEVGIIIDPVINLQDPNHHDWEAASVASKIDAHPDWSDPSKSVFLKANIEAGKKTGYTATMLRNILTITRGDDLQGHAMWYDETNWASDKGDPEDIPHYVRRRLHIVLLPGVLQSDPQENAMGISRDVGKFEFTDLSPLSLASGSWVDDVVICSSVFPWSQGASASFGEVLIDGGGCCIFTGRFPDVNDEEKVDYAGWVSPDHNPYCWIFTAIIAHEIGHSLGLAEESSDPKNIMYQTLTTNDPNRPYRHKSFQSISTRNQNEGKFINLRKMLGRETLTNRW